MDDVRAWQSRPLDDVYPVVFLDAFVLKVRENGSVARKACYLALGVRLDGQRDVLGMWFQDSEGAKFWMHVLGEIRRRGVRDILICCVDGLTGFPEAIEAVFPTHDRPNLCCSSDSPILALRAPPRVRDRRLGADESARSSEGAALTPLVRAWLELLRCSSVVETAAGRSKGKRFAPYVAGKGGRATEVARPSPGS